MTTTVRSRPGGPRPKTAPKGTGSRRARKAAPPAPLIANRDVVLLLAIVGVLTVFGLVMVLSASSVQALRDYGTSWFFFKRQAICAVLGVVALFVTARVDYRLWRKLAMPVMGVSVVLLLAVLIPGVGVTVSGSRRWLMLGPISLQPSEVAKLGLVLFIAELLSRRADRMDDARFTLRPTLLVAGVVALLVMKEPDMGTTLVLGAITFGMLFVAGVPLRWMGALTGIAAAGAFVLGMAAPYRRARMLSFIDPWADAGNTGYQVVQSLVGLGTGRVAGVGLGASRAKWGFLPNAHTDFIFTIIGEELGLIGSLTIIALIALLAFTGVRAALRAPDRFGTLLVAGLITWIVGQSVINLGAVTSLLPVAGVPLPFVSYGGTALVVLMGTVGIVVNVIRQSAPAKKR